MSSVSARTATDGAFVTQYESYHWNSGFGNENNDMQYSFYGDFCVVNPDKGVLAKQDINFGKHRCGDIDIKVKDGQVMSCGLALPIDPPQEENDGKVKAQLDKAAKVGGLMLEANAPKKAKKANKANKSAVAAVLKKKSGQDR